MKDWPVRENFFPFECNTPDCSEYNSREFCSAAFNMGYIWLTNEKVFLIGLTCPKCLKTTINKYSLNIPDFDIAQFSNFEHFVPFPSEIFQNRIPEKLNELYHLPVHFLLYCIDDSDFQSKPPLYYPKWFEDRCIYHIDENDVLEMLKHENENKERVFPRIISNDSVNNWTDTFLSYLKTPDTLVDDFENSLLPTFLNSLLIQIAKNYQSIGYAVETGITPDMVKNLAIEFAIPQHFPGYFMETIKEMLPEYSRKRNKIDFDLTFKTDFLDKYIKELFYIEDYHKSALRRAHKAEYEDFMSIPDMIGSSEYAERLSAVEVLARWGKDAAFLKSMILGGDIRAYGIDGVRLDPAASRRSPGGVSIADCIFLKMDVEYFERTRTWLRREAVEEKEEPLAGHERRRLGELEKQNEKLKRAIQAAVKMGIWVNAQKGPIYRKDGEEALYAIEQNVPNSIFDIIWKAFPDEKKWAGGKPKGTKSKKSDDF